MSGQTLIAARIPSARPCAGPTRSKCTGQWPKALVVGYLERGLDTRIRSPTGRLPVVAGAHLRSRTTGGIPWSPTAISSSACSPCRTG